MINLRCDLTRPESSGSSHQRQLSELSDLAESFGLHASL